MVVFCIDKRLTPELKQKQWGWRLGDQLEQDLGD